MGLGLAEAAQVVRRLAAACGSTAMVVCMHYCATAVIERTAPTTSARAIAAGRAPVDAGVLGDRARAATSGRRSAPRRSTATRSCSTPVEELGDVGRRGRLVRLDEPTRRRRPTARTLWLVPADAAGLKVGRAVRRARAARQRLEPGRAPTACALPVTARLGDDGAGLDIALGVVLPMFQILNASCSLGLMDAAIGASRSPTPPRPGSSTSTRRSPTSRSTRQHIAAHEELQADAAVDARRRRRSSRLSTGRADAPLRMLRVQGRRRRGRARRARRWRCGSAAARRSARTSGSSGHFRDARAVGGDGTDHRRAAGLHRPGALRPARCSAERERPWLTDRSRSAPSPTTRRSSRSGRASRTGSPRRASPSTTSCTPTTRRRPRRTSPAHVDVTWDSPLAWVRTRRLAAAAGREARAVAMRDTDQDLTSVVLVRADSDITDVAQLAGRTRRHRRDRLAAGDAAAARPPRRARVSTPAPSFAVRRFDVMVGKHGDHVGGERDAVQALVAGEVDAACVIDGNQLAVRQGGHDRRRRGARPDPHRAVRPLHDDRARRRRRRRRRPVRRAAAVDVVRRSRRCGRCSSSKGCKQWRPGRTDGLRPARGGRRSARLLRRRRLDPRRGLPAVTPATAAVVELGALGFDGGAHVLVKLALAELPTGRGGRRARHASRPRRPARRLVPPAGPPLARHADRTRPTAGAAGVVERGSAAGARLGRRRARRRRRPAADGAVAERPPRRLGPRRARRRWSSPAGPTPRVRASTGATRCGPTAPPALRAGGRRPVGPGHRRSTGRRRSTTADDVEAAVVQVMTFLVENEEAALVVPARFLGQVHPHFREIQQVLARHRRRRGPPHRGLHPPGHA